MKKIDKNVYETCDYVCNHTPGLSITKASELFGACRKTVAKHLKDYTDYSYFYNNSYYFISEEEKAPVLYFLENPEVSLEAAARKFGVKSNTIKRRMEVMGKEYSARVSRKYNRSIFKKLENIEQAYWLGFILADGYLNEDRGFLRIKLAITDENHLKKFGKFMQEENLENAIKYDCGGAYTKDNQCAYIEFSSRELTQDLVKLGIFQNKSGQEKPINMPNEEMEIAYIRGMIDGDGHIENGYFKYVGSLDSCNYLKEKFSKWFNFNPKCKYIYPKGTIYSFEIRNQKINNVLKKIYSQDIYLERKYEIVQEF